MDKKKKMILGRIVIVWALWMATLTAVAQDVSQILFCDKRYTYSEGNDSITLFLKFLDAGGKRTDGLTDQNLRKYLVITENGKTIPWERYLIKPVTGGQRIPGDYTFSVLVDQSMPPKGKERIYDAIGKLLESTQDSCVYLSFFGDSVSASRLVTKENYGEFKGAFSSMAHCKNFYGAVYVKLAEFCETRGAYENFARVQKGYAKNKDIIRRAKEVTDKRKNILFVFAEGSKEPEDFNDINTLMINNLRDSLQISPRVFSFYDTGEGENEDMITVLEVLANERNSLLRGACKKAENIDRVLDDFEEVVSDEMYDFTFTYLALPGKVYAGPVDYVAEWKGTEVGAVRYSIGSAERPWPIHTETVGDSVLKYLVAFLVALFTAVFFLCIIKVVIPFFKSKTFGLKYYKKYAPEANIQRRVCHFCRQDILPGQTIVARCEHIMHLHCWQQNGYKCAEYGQNCKTGIQAHVEWGELLKGTTLRDNFQMLAGVGAGLISWMIYELTGRGGFHMLATAIVDLFFANEEQRNNLFGDCVSKASAFLTIGCLLGFFLSLIFRYADEYRKKNWKIYLKIVGLSLLSSFIGIASFAIGTNLFCLILSLIGTTYIPWYCSLPAYLLFSVCVSLSLTVKSSIPVKSAMLGGVCSSVIGFAVLCFSSVTSARYGWMNMLLDFIIYGGGLGASLVTVRMLAEKYFLVIQNGVKAGQRIPIHKWMGATGGGNKVTIGMTGECEIQMNWEKSNKVAKEHVQLYIDYDKQLPMLKPLATGVILNARVELPVGKPAVLSNNDTFKVGETIFQYVENE